MYVFYEHFYKQVLLITIPFFVVGDILGTKSNQPLHAFWWKHTHMYVRILHVASENG